MERRGRAEEFIAKAVCSDCGGEAFDVGIANSGTIHIICLNPDCRAIWASTPRGCSYVAGATATLEGDGDEQADMVSQARARKNPARVRRGAVVLTSKDDDRGQGDAKDGGKGHNEVNALGDTHVLPHGLTGTVSHGGAPFDRVAYQRGYMRKWRAARRPPAKLP